MQIKVINCSKNALPEYKTEGSAGMDLRADIVGSLKLSPNQIRTIPTGLYIEIPENEYEFQIRSRSGLAMRGIIVLNSPATIDSDYRGEIKVILANFGNDEVTIKSGDRIAQMVLCKIEKCEWKWVLQLDSTKRGMKGFGSTGVE